MNSDVQAKLVAQIDLKITRCLTRREYSFQELVYKLIRLGYPSILVNERVAFFREKELQSDLRFVENFCRTRQNQGYGSIKILLELGQKGIEETLLKSITKDLITFDSEVLERLINKKGWKSLSRKEITFLLGRGFTWEQINRLKFT